MASLKKCNACGHEVSQTADACPNCGLRFKRRWDEIGPFTIKVIIGAVILLLLIPFCSEANQSNGAIKPHKSFNCANKNHKPDIPKDARPLTKSLY